MFRRDVIVVPVIPIRAPFVDIFRNVAQAKAVRRMLADARRPVPPGAEVMRLALRRLVAPGIEFVGQTAARGAFPFSFGRQAIGTAGAFSKPRAIGRGIEPAYAGNGLLRMIELFIEEGRRQ